jgi:hypothetical protein
MLNLGGWCSALPVGVVSERTVRVEVVAQRCIGEGETKSDNGGTLGGRCVCVCVCGGGGGGGGGEEEEEEEEEEDGGGGGGGCSSRGSEGGGGGSRSARRKQN